MVALIKESFLAQNAWLSRGRSHFLIILYKAEMRNHSSVQISCFVASRFSTYQVMAEGSHGCSYTANDDPVNMVAAIIYDLPRDNQA